MNWMIFTIVGPALYYLHLYWLYRYNQQKEIIILSLLECINLHIVAPSSFSSLKPYRNGQCIGVRTIVKTVGQSVEKASLVHGCCNRISISTLFDESPLVLFGDETKRNLNYAGVDNEVEDSMPSKVSFLYWIWILCW